MIVHNGNIVVNNGRWINEPTPPEPPTPPGPSFDEVTIGTQVWMTKNLDIDDGGEGIKTYDFTNDPVLSSLGIQYYYTKEAAQRLANSIDGWHLPTRDEWNTLINYVGHPQAGTKLKSTSGWYDDGNGTDDYGFNAIPVGYYYDTERTYLSELYKCTKFQADTDTNISLLKALYWNQSYITNEANGGHPRPACSVRLIKDY